MDTNTQIVRPATATPTAKATATSTTTTLTQSTNHSMERILGQTTPNNTTTTVTHAVEETSDPNVLYAQKQFKRLSESMVDQVNDVFSAEILLIKQKLAMRSNWDIRCLRKQYQDELHKSLSEEIKKLNVIYSFLIQRLKRYTNNCPNCFSQPENLWFCSAQCISQFGSQNQISN